MIWINYSAKVIKISGKTLYNPNFNPLEFEGVKIDVLNWRLKMEYIE
jgi:hypothetical protein